MTCAEIRSQLSAFVDAALPAAQQAEVAAHVQGCPACAREVAVLQQTVQQLQQLRVSDAPDLLPGVRRKLSAASGWRGIALPVFRWPMPALALATSLMLVVIAVRVVPWRQELREYQSPASAPIDISSPAGIGGGKLATDTGVLSKLKKDQSKAQDYNGVFSDASSFSASKLPMEQTRDKKNEAQQEAERKITGVPVQRANKHARLEDDEALRQDHDMGLAGSGAAEELVGGLTDGRHAGQFGTSSPTLLGARGLDNSRRPLVLLPGWLEEEGTAQKPMPPFYLEAQADVVALGTIGEPFTAQGQQLVGLVLEEVLKGQVLAAPLVTPDAMPFLGCILPARVPRPSEVFAPGTPVVVYLTQREGQWRILALTRRLPAEHETRQRRFVALLAFLAGKVSPAETLQRSPGADDVEYAALLWALDAAHLARQ